MEMKSTIAILAVVAAALTTPALAGSTSLEKTMKENGDFVIALKAKQESYCIKPRSNTPVECNASFDDAFGKIYKAIGLLGLYIVANDGSNASHAKMLREQHSQALAIAISAVKHLEKDYYPLPKVSEARK
jgi:hypothetical protein